MRVLRAAAAAAILVTASVAAPAAAAGPANDTYSGIVTIPEPLPFTTTLDTTQATTDAADAEFVAGCEGIPSTDASVWYAFTPSADGGYVVDMAASSYPAGAVVASGVPGAWTVESCGPTAVGWFGSAGTTYTILVVDDQSDGGGNGGQLVMTVDLIPPPPTIDVTVNPTGTFNSRTGEATVTGWVTCDPGTASEPFAELDVEATQRVGRFLVRGYSYQEVSCDGTRRPWTALVAGETGLFKGGKAMTVAVGFGCGDYDCSTSFVETVVQLKGGKR